MLQIDSISILYNREQKFRLPEVLLSLLYAKSKRSRTTGYCIYVTPTHVVKRKEASKMHYTSLYVIPSRSFHKVIKKYKTRK